MFSFCLATPEKVVFDDLVYSVTVPGSLGYFQILQRHAPLISTLNPGKIIVIDKQRKKQAWIVSNGIFEMAQNKATLLADSIDMP